MHHTPEMAAEGGLAAYGPRFSEVGRMQARLLVKVLGAEPGLVPIWNWQRNGVPACQNQPLSATSVHHRINRESSAH